MNKDLIKTAQGYEYRGVAITKDKGGFTFGFIYNNPSKPFNPKICCVVEVNNSPTP